MVEKTQNTSFGNTEENTNDEPVEQLNPEQKALLDTYLMQLEELIGVVDQILTINAASPRDLAN